jgi:SAM-dependent methyltransferase
MKREELELQARLEDSHFWYAGRRRQVVERLPRATASDRWALDLGAGSGGNSPLLVDAGYRTIALEHDPVAAAVTHDRGIDVVRADAHDLPFPDAAFDVVLACDVLEHLSDDKAATAELYRVLKPGGTLLLTVPADPRLWSVHDVALSHHRRYTRDSLRSVLEGGGFRIQQLDAWMVLLRPLVRLRRAVGRHGHDHAHKVAEESASDLEPVNRLVNGVLSAALRLEQRMTSLRRREGVSLIVRAVRP